MEIPTLFPRKNRTAPVNPKVELTQSDYNRLVQMAQMKAKKIEERAREIYEKEGVTKIEFTGRFYRDHGVGSTDHFSALKNWMFENKFVSLPS